MPLGFLPKDFLAVPVRSPPETLGAPSNSTKEPVAEATPVPTVPTPPPVVEVTPLPEVPATLPSVDTRDLPAGFEELPLDAPTRPGMIYGPSVKETQATPSIEVEPAPVAVAPIPTEELPLATPVVTRETRTNHGNLYDAQNPQLAAMLSKLPGIYHSDRTAGFHRSPRIDNSGPSPAMLINGRVVNNLLLDCGAEAIITGRPGAAAMEITPAMIQRNAIVIRTAIGELVRLDQTKEPVSCTLNPGTADEVTVMAHVVIVKHDLPDTLIGMSVIGPAGLQPCFYKQRVKYYIDRDTQYARKAFLRCQFPIDYSKSPTNAFTAIRACTGAVIIRVKSPSNLQEVKEAQRRIADFQGRSVPEITGLFDRSMVALKTPSARVLPVENPAYQHIRPLDTGLVDKRHVLSAASSGMVVVELCSCLGATIEAVLCQGVKIRKVYACENDAKMRLISEERLATFCKIYPQQISEEAVIIDAHTHLPQDIRRITRSHAATMERPDLVVVGFPCQGFSHASGNALGLRDSRTKLLEEAIRVIHLINEAWPDRPCGYLFENVDAVDHPQRDVRDEFNTVVRRLLGPEFAFDAVAVGSSPHRHRRWWTNLAPHLLLLEMVENKFKLRNPDQYVQKQLEPGRQAQNAKHSAAPGRHSVNVPGQPLRAFLTFVTVRGSHAFRPGQQSMVQDTATGRAGTRTRHGLHR
jgi:hypothetical protein